MTGLWLAAVALAFVAGALLSPYFSSLAWWVGWTYHKALGHHARHRKG